MDLPEKRKVESDSFAAHSLKLREERQALINELRSLREESPESSARPDRSEGRLSRSLQTRLKLALMGKSPPPQEPWECDGPDPYPYEDD